MLLGFIATGSETLMTYCTVLSLNASPELKLTVSYTFYIDSVTLLT